MMMMMEAATGMHTSVWLCRGMRAGICSWWILIVTFRGTRNISKHKLGLDSFADERRGFFYLTVSPAIIEALLMVSEQLPTAGLKKRYYWPEDDSYIHTCTKGRYTECSVRLWSLSVCIHKKLFPWRSIKRYNVQPATWKFMGIYRGYSFMKQVQVLIY